MSLDLGAVVVVDMTGAGQFVSILVAQYNAPRIGLNLDATLTALIHHIATRLAYVPLVATIGRLTHQHHIVGWILRNNRTSEDTQTDNTFVDWLDAELEIRTLVVGWTREIKILERSDPITIGIESLTRMKLVSAPLYHTLALSLIERYKLMRSEDRV